MYQNIRKVRYTSLIVFGARSSNMARTSEISKNSNVYSQYKYAFNFLYDAGVILLKRRSDDKFASIRSPTESDTNAQVRKIALAGAFHRANVRNADFLPMYYAALFGQFDQEDGKFAELDTTVCQTNRGQE